MVAFGGIAVAAVFAVAGLGPRFGRDFDVTDCFCLPQMKQVTTDEILSAPFIPFRFP